MQWNCKRCIEFWEGDDGRLSMTRLTMLLAFIPSTYVLVENPSEGMMGWYLGAFVGGYVGGKFGDAVGRQRPSMHVDNVEEVSVETKSRRNRGNIQHNKRGR